MTRYPRKKVIGDVTFLLYPPNYYVNTHFYDNGSDMIMLIGLGFLKSINSRDHKKKFDEVTNWYNNKGIKIEDDND